MSTLSERALRALAECQRQLPEATRVRRAADEKAQETGTADDAARAKKAALHVFALGWNLAHPHGFEARYSS